MRIAGRIEALPPYLFAALDEKLDAKRAVGVDVISLGVGDPDRPTPPHIVAAMKEAVEDPATHRYPSYYGTIEFRTAVADWYRRRFGVELDPATEVLALLGSKEGLAHLPVAFIDPGDEALVADPGYPVYGTGVTLAGGTPVSLPMPAERGFLPAFEEAPVTERTRYVVINFPGNPTAAVADLDLFAGAVDFARRHGLLLVHDAAYTEITFDGYVAPSVLQVPGAKEVAIEFHSLSKHHNMTGWRIGFCVGNAEAIRALATVKTNVDSGAFTAIQRAAVAALTGPDDHVEELRTIYQQRRDLVVDTFNQLGWSLKPPLGSIYVWLPVPDGHTSVSFADLLLDEAGVFVAPGSGYGANGEGYVRLSLTVPDDRLAEAMARIAQALGGR
ncbi:MAG TPA: LL-diaminopimelate aminotransferase [Actinomycetota bacterium]|nr:LL-diaminopimelate aminotransferase [Actinomycetota bacterium]